jgi:hypothetical protein
VLSSAFDSKVEGLEELFVGIMNILEIYDAQEGGEKGEDYCYAGVKSSSPRFIRNEIRMRLSALLTYIPFSSVFGCERFWIKYSSMLNFYNVTIWGS